MVDENFKRSAIKYVENTGHRGIQLKVESKYYFFEMNNYLYFISIVPGLFFLQLLNLKETMKIKSMLLKPSRAVSEYVFEENDLGVQLPMRQMDDYQSFADAIKVQSTKNAIVSKSFDLSSVIRYCKST